MVRLAVRDYSIYSPVLINRRRKGAFRMSAGRLGLISEHPIQGSAFNTKKVMDWVLFGENAKYFRV